MKFKDERQQLESDKKRIQKELSDLQVNLEQSHKKYFSLKTEIEESPVTVLRNELATKQMECNELVK